MSLKVVVICEDDVTDGPMLRPIIEAMVQHLGRKPRVTSAGERLRGVTEAMKPDRILRIIRRFPMADCFVLVVDRDGVAERKRQLESLEETVNREARAVFLAENAWQEAEVWVLAGHEDVPGPWPDIRNEPHPKERYYLPYAAQRGVLDQPGQGRTTLSKEGAARYAKRVRVLCDEVRDLESRLGSVGEA
jgi:hypothetical protein